MKTRGTRSAFTLAELLIVIVIIGILMALLLPAILKGTVRSQVAVTKAKMSGIAMAVDAFQRDFGFYPPTDRAFNPGTGKFDGDAYNDPDNALSKAGEFAYNEALVQCLCNRYTKGAGDGLDAVKYPTRVSIHGVNKIIGGAPVTTAAPYLDVKASDLVDKDGDGFPELVDAWGNPFIYIPKDDYLQYFPDGTQYNVGARIWTDTNKDNLVVPAELGDQYQRFKFQLISLGPDRSTIWVDAAGALKVGPARPYIGPVNKVDPEQPLIGTDDNLRQADANRARGFAGDDINNWGQ
jgi:prepilin-type N-terminal cleavage/methylation domain-containing protein